MLRVVVLISGGGSNLQAIIDAIANKHLKAKIVAVISNRRDAQGLKRAEKHGIDGVYFPLKPYKDRGETREVYDADLAKAITLYRPDLIVLAGWMHILSPAFLEKFPRQVINLHPALPGEFAGTNAIERAFDAGERGEIKYSGVMVHHAIPEIDAGDVIIYAQVPILPGETLDNFETRMHRVEHRVLVQAIATFTDDFI